MKSVPGQGKVTGGSVVGVDGATYRQLELLLASFAADARVQAEGIVAAAARQLDRARRQSAGVGIELPPRADMTFLLASLDDSVRRFESKVGQAGTGFFRAADPASEPQDAIPIIDQAPDDGKRDDAIPRAHPPSRGGLQHRRRRSELRANVLTGAAAMVLVTIALFVVGAL